MKYALVYLLLFFVSQLKSQQVSIAPYIKAWKVTGKAQSFSSQVFFDSLRVNKNNEAFRKKYFDDIRELDKYLIKKPDRRLTVRLMMYKIMAAREFKLPLEPYFKMINDAIKLAYPLQDEQLNAELYSIRADVPRSSETNMLYNLKAIEIQKRIGFRYFPYSQNRYFEVSSRLYEQGDYRQAIDYGKQGITLWKLDSLHRTAGVYIFQCDIIGASYKKLGIYDSSMLFYKKIKVALETETTPLVKSLWMGIVNGNIGQTYTMQKKYAEALPLLTDYLSNSIKEKDTLNIVMAQNALAQYYFQQSNYHQALSFASHAWRLAEKNGISSEMITSTKFLSDIFKKTGKLDSALFYTDIYHKYKDLAKEISDKSQLSVVNAQIAFDDVQHSLQLSQSKINREKRIRNAILTAISIIAVIIFLLYNRQKLRQTYKLREIELQHQAALKDAKEKVAAFANNIIEKNNLIDSLREKIDNIKPAETEIPENLLQYTLLTDEEWENFKKEFVTVYPRFFVNLQEGFQNLTPAMERLAALIFLKLNNYQIANTLGISKESVARSKRRLRTGIGLPPEHSLENYIISLS